VRAHHGHAVGAHGGADVGGLGRGEAERLLAQHVLARLRGGDDRVAVQVMRQADVDRVEFGRGEHLGVGGEDRRVGAGGATLGVLANRVGDGRELDDSRVAQVAGDVGPGDAACADEADAHRRGAGCGW
jgi:hypothetical protein